MGAAGTVVILAAGQGKRMRSALPKVLHAMCGRPMLGYVLDQAFSLDPERVVLVAGVGADQVREYVASTEYAERVEVVIQAEQLGTGHAVACALPAIPGPGAVAGAPGAETPVVVLYGDMPLLRPESLEQLCARFAAQTGERGACITTARPANPRGFGRIVRAGGQVQGIVEERDASAEQRVIDEVNVGVYAFRADDLHRFLPELKNDNAQAEYYLTEVVDRVLAEGRRVDTLELDDEREAIGVNTLGHLAECRSALQERILEQHLEAGVFIEDPATTYVDHGVEIGVGTRILPCTVIRAGVRIGAGCEVGPFTHLRVGTVRHDGAEIGIFTEAKKATVGAKTKAKHLTYLGDVTIGAGANIGAGTIVANYDGTHKHATQIGDRAFIGSGSVIIAPANIGAGALTGGGAVVTRNSTIPDGEAWVGVPARPLRRNPESS